MGTARPTPREKIDRLLEPGERLLWHGRPRGRYSFSGFAIWILAIPWLGFSLFWTWMAWHQTRGLADEGLLGLAASILFPAFGLPFVLVGLLLFLLPIAAITQPGRTLYAVTDRRVIFTTHYRRSLVRSLAAGQITGIDVRDDASGGGSITIETNVMRPAKRGRTGAKPRAMTRKIEDIANIRSAERALRQLVSS